MQRKRILIIDDEEDVVTLLRFKLRQKGYDVFCAHDGKEGLHWYEEERPDLILLDIMIPEMDGHEVYRHIKEEKNDRQTPIIVLTASQDEAACMTEALQDSDRCITKPYEIVELLAAVAELLENRLM